MRVVLVAICLFSLVGCTSSPDPREEPLRQTVNKIKVLAKAPETKQLMVRETIALGLVDDAVQFTKLPMKLMKDMSDKVEKAKAKADKDEAITASSGESTDGPSPESKVSVDSKSTKAPPLFSPPLPKGDEKPGAGIDDSSAKADKDSIEKDIEDLKKQVKDKVSSSLVKQPIDLMTSLNEDKTATQIAKWMSTRDKSIRKAVNNVFQMGNPDAKEEETSSSNKGKSPDGTFPARVCYGTPDGPWCVVIRGDDREHKLICDAYGDNTSKVLFTESIALDWK